MEVALMWVFFDSILERSGLIAAFTKSSSLEMITPEVFIGLGDLIENGFRVGRGSLRIGPIRILSGAGNRRDGQNECDGCDIFHSHLEHIQTSFMLSFQPIGKLDQSHRKIGFNNENVEWKMII